jgi:hypothetical protein
MAAVFSMCPDQLPKKVSRIGRAGVAFTATFAPKGRTPECLIRYQGRSFSRAWR